MKLSVVVLAAGLGTRMRSSIPKVLHSLCGKPLIHYVLDALMKVKAERTIVVVNPHNARLGDVLKDYPVEVAVQAEQKGTADALKAAARRLKDGEGTVLVVNGDAPLVTTAALKEFLKLHRNAREDISILSFIADDPRAYGRIVRKGKDVVSIVEDRDADEEQKEIKEVNSGIYALESPALDLLRTIKMNASKGEYYLTDIVDAAVRKGYRVGAHILGSEREFTGINTREDLHRAGHYLRDLLVMKLMEKGVSFIDRASVFIHPEAEIGTDTVIYPNVHIEGKTVIGRACTIGPNTRIADSVLGNDVVIKDSTVIESSTVKERATVGPFAHVRPGSVIGSSAKIGNFVEVKKSVIGHGSKASHLSYLGDAEIGNDVNIGAGTITCNYDGKEKHKTVIKDGVFIGSDTQLIAPVTVGKKAYVGAGSTITKDVPALSLALSRAAQQNIEKWVETRQLKVKGVKTRGGK